MADPPAPVASSAKSRVVVSLVFLVVLGLALARVVATRPPAPVETTFVVDLLVLAPLVLFAVLIAWLHRRFPRYPQWLEQQVPWLFPADMARHWEAMARERPLSFLGTFFFLSVGAFSIAGDIGNFRPSPLLRYGAACIVSVYVLFVTRRARRVRPTLLGGSERA